MNTTKTAITLALTAALGSAGVANAGDNPFAMRVLKQGNQVAEMDGKTQDGKCGASKAKEMEEAKCGANKEKAEAKTKEGKCGAGKTETMPKEGKCGAGMKMDK